MCKRVHNLLLGGKIKFNAVKFQLCATCAYTHRKRGAGDHANGSINSYLNDRTTSEFLTFVFVIFYTFQFS